jgi:hypothetical protein
LLRLLLRLLLLLLLLPSIEKQRAATAPIGAVAGGSLT